MGQSGRKREIREVKRGPRIRLGPQRTWNSQREEKGFREGGAVSGWPDLCRAADPTAASFLVILEWGLSGGHGGMFPLSLLTLRRQRRPESFRIHTPRLPAVDGRKLGKEGPGRPAVSPPSTSQGIETPLLIVSPLFLASDHLRKKSHRAESSEAPVGALCAGWKEQVEAVGGARGPLLPAVCTSRRRGKDG